MIELVSNYPFFFWSLILAFIFSRWTPIKITYFKDSPNANNSNREMSSGASYIRWNDK